jgi:mRNA interferase MazF
MPPTSFLPSLMPTRMAPIRGEVWLFDLGMTEKVRPALIVSVRYGDLDRALVTIVLHTTSLRGSQYEIAIDVAFLKPGAFLAQNNVATYPNVRAIRKLGTLKKDQFDAVFSGLLGWLGHPGHQS